jgi:CheY-like chemotaxis protein
VGSSFGLVLLKPGRNREDYKFSAEKPGMSPASPGQEDHAQPSGDLRLLSRGFFLDTVTSACSYDIIPMGWLPRRIAPWLARLVPNSTQREFPVDDFTKLIQALAAVAWPALVSYVLWTYRKQVAAVIESAKGRKFTVEVGGQKLTMEEANQQQQNLIADLQQQLLELRTKVEGFKISPQAALADTPSSPPAGNAILWVDDNPKNNSYFIDLLQKHGYRVDLARSTAEGIRKAENHSYRVILSDMGRMEDGRFDEEAGIHLLAALRKRGSRIPFVVCSTEQAVRRFRDQLKELGAMAITSSTTELRGILDKLAPAIDA